MQDPVPSSPRPFVGRARELAELRTVVDAAGAGRGSVYLITGEPGIGKSRFADEVSRYGHESGAAVAWGRCWEAGGAPAYWPWVQVLRSLVRRTPSIIGEGGNDRDRVLAQIVPEFAAEPATLPMLPPEEARFALYDAVTLFLTGLAERAPLVIVLEDLHVADVSSLQLLQ
ncbi:MAG: AAA family ATPase, partial [Actinomycetota bacterium]